MDYMSRELPALIHSELNELDVEKQRRVLAFVRTLKQLPKGMSGAQLKGFAEASISLPMPELHAVLLELARISETTGSRTGERAQA